MAKDLSVASIDDVFAEFQKKNDIVIFVTMKDGKFELRYNPLSLATLGFLEIIKKKMTETLEAPKGPTKLH